MAENTPRTQELEEAFLAFNQLSEQLAASYRDLEAKVARLSEELEEAHGARIEELAEKERLAQRLESLLTGLPAGVVVLDGSGKVQQANPAAVTLLGEPLLGEAWRDIINRAFVLDDNAGYDLKLRDGRLVSLSTCPLGSEPGQILLLTDVTESRLLQEKANRQQRLMSMGEMAASLAHQIRTPLASALLYASHLKRPALADADREKFADKILARMRHLETLVNDMLIFARGGVGGAEEVPVNELLEELRVAVEPQLQSSDTVFTIHDDTPGLVLRCNRELLLSGLQNLVTNAIQAMGDGGKITVTSVRFSKGLVDIVVTDNGPGIEPGLQEKILEPFFTTRNKGTGLGLAVVQALARAHQGDLWLKSEVGKGSSFGLRLPVIGGQ